MNDEDLMTKDSNLPENDSTAPVSVEAALTRILALSQDRSLTEKRLRIQVWGFAKAALEQIAAEKLKREQAGHSKDLRNRDLVATAGTPPVAWLHVWSGLPKEVRTKLAEDKYGLSEAIPLHTDEWGEIVAWRWGDGGGYNADYRYSFVDPLENPEEVEAQNAESVIGCKPLYLHPLAKGYKA
jgi:hypothetical protein